ncbi:MAG: PcfJ domain-containing protein, partial [Gloeomargarita sp. HHBFW_bins_162]
MLLSTTCEHSFLLPSACRQGDPNRTYPETTARLQCQGDLFIFYLRFGKIFLHLDWTGQRVRINTKSYQRQRTLTSFTLRWSGTAFVGYTYRQGRVWRAVSPGMRRLVGTVSLLNDFRHSPALRQSLYQAAAHLFSRLVHGVKPWVAEVPFEFNPDNADESSRQMHMVLGAAFIPAWDTLGCPQIEIPPNRKNPLAKAVYTGGLTDIAKVLFGVGGKQYRQATIALLRYAQSFYDSEHFAQLPWRSEEKLQLVQVLVQRQDKLLLLSWLITIALCFPPRRFLQVLQQRDFDLDWFTMLDLVSMINRITKAYGEPLRCPRGLTLAEFHDVCTWLNNRLPQRLVYSLWRHPEFEQFDGQKVADYQLKLPSDTAELSEWGVRLGICVGSYDERINRGEAIVFGLYRQEKITVCVGIAPGKQFVIQQVYGHQNTPLPPSLA